MSGIIRPIQLIMNLNSKLFLNATEDVTDEMAMLRPNNTVNNIIFISAHLLDARYFLANIIGLNSVCPFKDVFDSVNRIEDSGRLPAIKDIRSTWAEFGPQIAVHLSGLDEESINKKSSFKFPIPADTILGVVTFLLSHESYHIGQIGMIRKFLNLPSLKFE
jgi:hypothetical protein